MRRWTTILFLLLSYITSADAQILIDEGWGSASKLKSESRTFTDGSSLRSKKRVGLGASFVGAVGLVGVNLNINFTPDYVFSFGVGQSHGFQTANASLKSILGGKTLQPYFVTGYANWRADGDSENMEDTSPAILANRFLSRRERETGRFSEHVFYPGIGLEYLNTNGSLQGLSYYAEALWLVDVDDLQMGATGGIGTIYYF